MAVNVGQALYTWESCRGDLTLSKLAGEYRLSYESKDHVVTQILPENILPKDILKQIPTGFFTVSTEKIKEFCQNYFFTLKKVNEDYKIVLFEADIRDVFEEEVISKPKGLGSIGFEFNKLEKPEYLEIVETGPSYRIISRGLNLEGTCANKVCEAFEKMVIIPKGASKEPFRIAEELDESDCPACGENIPFKNIRRLGFWNCTFEVKGRQIAPEEKKVDYKGSAEKKHYTTYQNEDNCQWSFLNITVPEEKNSICTIL